MSRLAFIRPALAVPGKAPPKGDQWVHEPKWDGYRCQVIKDETGVRLFSKNGSDWTKKLPAMAKAMGKLPAKSAILDCELCYAGADGRPSFRGLMAQMRTAKPDPFHLVLYAFGLMHLDGQDLRPEPLSERRRSLVQLGEKGSAIPCLFIPDQFADGADLMQWCEKYRLEGVVSKKKDAPYVSGECKAWVKSKCLAWKEQNKDRGDLFEGAKLRDTTPGRGRR